MPPLPPFPSFPGIPIFDLTVLPGLVQIVGTDPQMENAHQADPSGFQPPPDLPFVLPLLQSLPDPNSGTLLSHLLFATISISPFCSYDLVALRYKFKANLDFVL